MPLRIHFSRLPASSTTFSPSSLVNACFCASGRISSTTSEGRHSRVPSGVTTIGRLIRIGCCNIKSIISCDARNLMHGQKNGSPSTDLITPVCGQMPPYAAGLAYPCSRANIRFSLLKSSGWRKHARTFRRGDRYVSIKNELWINTQRSPLSECE